jgi:squalene-hopene/tetraprenyl-beta-curcumene cyclase
MISRTHTAYFYRICAVALAALLLCNGVLLRAQTADDSHRVAVERAIDRAKVALDAQQRPDGYWAGHVIMAARHTAYYVLASNYTAYFDRPHYDRSVQWLIDSQQPDGTWGHSALTPTPATLANTAVAALALDVAGVSKRNLKLIKAHQYVATHGGVNALDPLAQTLYALFNRTDWETDALKQFDITALKAPRDSPASLRARPAWWREAFVPCATLRSLHRKNELSLSERQALRVAEEWLLNHQSADGAWFTAIPTVLSVMALHDLDPKRYRSRIADGFRFMRELKLPNGYQTPFKLSVWDTSIAIIAMRAADVDACDLNLQRSIRWLANAQSPGGLDLSETPPGGWSYNPDAMVYSDADDTGLATWAMSQLLGRSAHTEFQRRLAVKRGIEWLLYMQGGDGGWATFIKDEDQENDSLLPTGIEDPSMPDVTAHALSALGLNGYRSKDERVKRAINYLQRSQTAQGSWYGRWGLSYLYGTGAVLVAMKDVKADMSAPFIQKGADWLIAAQNPDGGWGEEYAAWDAARGIVYSELSKMSTSEQTAWAVMGLLNINRPDAARAVRRGVDYLLATQGREGDWTSGHYTVLGIDPYSNTLYATHWPLMALGFYRQTVGPGKLEEEERCYAYRVAYQSLPDIEKGTPVIGGAGLSFSLVAEDSSQARLWIENKDKYGIRDLNISLSPEGAPSGPTETRTIESLDAGSRKSLLVKTSAAPYWNLSLSYSDIAGHRLKLERTLKLEGGPTGIDIRGVVKVFGWVLLLGIIGLAVFLGTRRFRPFLSLGFNNLRRHPLRTWLTSLGVIMGTAAIGSTLTLSMAFRAKLIQDFAAFGTNRLIVLSYQPEVKFGPPAESLRRQPGARFSDADVANVEGVAQVTAASAFVQEDLPVVHQGESLNVTVLFVDPESYPDVAAQRVESGRFLMEDKKREVVLGYATARDAFARPVKVDDKITIDGSEFTVVGTMAEVGGVRGRQGAIVSPDIVLFASLDEATEFTGRNYYDGIEARAESATVTESVASRVDEVIRHRHGSTQFGVVSSERLLKQVENLLSQFTAIVSLIGLLTLLVSGIGVANMMLISVRERIDEIGIMKALGAKDRTILTIFLSEAGGIGLLGAAAGCVLGFVLLLLLQQIAGVAVLPVAPYLLAFSVIFSVLITIVCGAYPAYKAARLEPAEAIRHV